MNRVYYELSHMNNTSMKTSLKNALDKIEGVQNINVDIAQGSVEIEFNEPANEQQIKTCIENTGFLVS